MPMPHALLITATALNGILAGASLDQSVKQVPSRRRISNLAYAVYVRGADLGTGKLWYILLANTAVLFTLAAAVTIRPNMAIDVAAALSIAHTITTIGAAPKLLRSKKISLDDEPALASLFDGFERWQTVRAVLQVATFAASLWALAA